MMTVECFGSGLACMQPLPIDKKESVRTYGATHDIVPVPVPLSFQLECTYWAAACMLFIECARGFPINTRCFNPGKIHESRKKGRGGFACHLDDIL